MAATPPGGVRKGAFLLAGLALAAAGCSAPGDGAGASARSSPADTARAGLPEATSGLGGYLAGRHARLHNDTAAAHVYFARALEDDPANPQLLNAALVGALAERDMETAGALARKLAAASPDSLVARVALATEATVAGAPAEALAQIDALPAQGGARFIAPLLRAWSLAAVDDPDGALETLRGLGSNANFSAIRDYHSALIADLWDRPAEAEGGYAGALGAARGNSLRAALAAGNFYRRRGRDDEARAVYDAFLEANPDTAFLDSAYRSLDEDDEAPPPADAGDGYAEALYGIAAVLTAEDALESALVYAQLCLAVRPAHDACRMLLGEVLADMERYAEAVAAWDAVPGESPLTWAARLHAADALAELGEVEAAARRLRAMTRQNPVRADAPIALADMMLGEKRYDEAADAYDRALARIPALERRHWPLLYARGMSLERSRQWERAEDDFLRALELEPDQPLVLNYLGYSWVEMGRNYDRARRMIARAVEQRPDDGYIVDSLGWVLFRLGEYDEAVRHLERAVSLRPGDPVILDHFGDSLWRVGRRHEAYFQWRRALAFGPEPELEEALRDKVENGLADEPGTGDAAARAAGDL